MNQYPLKFEYITSARIGRVLKNIIKDASDDRKAAKEIYTVAVKAYKLNPQDSDLGKVVADLLKISQAANNPSIRSAEIMLKYLNGNSTKAKAPAKMGKNVPSFADMNDLSEDD